MLSKVREAFVCQLKRFPLELVGRDVLVCLKMRCLLFPSQRNMTHTQAMKVLAGSCSIHFFKRKCHPTMKRTYE